MSCDGSRPISSACGRRHSKPSTARDEGLAEQRKRLVHCDASRIPGNGRDRGAISLGDDALPHDRTVRGVRFCIALRSPPAVRAMKPFERLGEARTPNGTLIALYRHDGAYLIRADGVELMSTRRHLSEDRLAEVACAPLRETPRARVLIGGLGLGFTLRAALRQLRDDAEVVVAEFLPEVIAWNADPRYDLSVEAMRDPRVRVVQSDVIDVLRATPAPSMRSCSTRTTGLMGCSCPRTRRCTQARHRGHGRRAARRRLDRVLVCGRRPAVRRRAAQLGTRSQVAASPGACTAGPMHTLYVATAPAQ